MDKDLFDYIKMGWDKMTSKKKGEAPAEKPVQPQTESTPEKVDAVKQQEVIEQPLPESIHPQKQWNYIAFLEKMPDLILARIGKLNIKGAAFAEKDLIIFCEDEEIVESMEQNGFAQYLKDYLDLKSEISFRNISIRQGKPALDMYNFKVNDEITLAIDNPKKDEPAKDHSAQSATLEVMGTRCKLEDSPVILVPEKGKVWNIGWGKETEVNGLARLNQIAWTYAHPENENTKIFLVSRAHAHIKYINGCFNLIADIRGTRQAGKSTKVQRGEKPEELLVPGLTYPLQDKDIIHLNKEKMIFRLLQAEK